MEKYRKEKCEMAYKGKTKKKNSLKNRLFQIIMISTIVSNLCSFFYDDFFCRKKADSEIHALFSASDQHKPGSGVPQSGEYYAEPGAAGKQRKSCDRLFDAV